MTGSSNQPLLELPDVQTWDLDSKVVLITGGASGIGAATARLAASDGANVLVCDVDETNGREVANEVNGHFISLDVTSADSWQAAAKDLDRLDIAIQQPHQHRDLQWQLQGPATHARYRQPDRFGPDSIQFDHRQ